MKCKGCATNVRLNTFRPIRTQRFYAVLQDTQIKHTTLPRIPFSGSPLNKFTPDFSGAVSLKSIISADRLLLSYTIINPPPPIPVECMLMTPTHRVVAMAASTAEPPFLRMFRPTLEHSALSAATAAWRYAYCLPGSLTFVGLPIGKSRNQNKRLNGQQGPFLR